MAPIDADSRTRLDGHDGLGKATEKDRRGPPAPIRGDRTMDYRLRAEWRMLGGGQYGRTGVGPCRETRTPSRPGRRLVAVDCRRGPGR
jgi:hypothetical protein